MYASEAKKSEFLVHLDHFQNFSNILKNGLSIIKIGVHLINVELSQLLTLTVSNEKSVVILWVS